MMRLQLRSLGSGRDKGINWEMKRRIDRNQRLGCIYSRCLQALYRRLSFEDNFESLDTAHHREVKVDDPGRIAGRHGKTFLYTGRERMGHWRGAGVEVVVVVVVF